MRVLHIPHAYAPVRGGAELVCQRVGEELVSMGHTVRVVTADVSSVESYYRFGLPHVGPAREHIAGVEVVRIPYGGRLYDLGYWISKVPFARLRGRIEHAVMRIIRAGFSSQLAHEIADYRPDVVVLLPHLVVNVQCALKIRQTRLLFPTVMLPLLHEYDPNWPMKEVRDALRWADAVVALTTHEVAQLRSSYVEDPSLVFLGGAGIDIPSSQPPANRRAAVVYVGRKSEQKGVLRLLRAMQRVWRTRPDVRLTIAGTRSSDTGRIEEAIAQLPADQRARVASVDNISNEEKLRLLREANCLVLPSRCDSFGIVLLEAWACETPVIAYDLPVFRSTVDHELNGLLVDPESVDSLAAAIEQLVANPDRAESFGRAGYAKALKEFNWRTVAERFLVAYEHAASRPTMKQPSGGRLDRGVASSPTQ